MSLPVPLSVRLVTAAGDRHVTRDLRDLTYRAAIPGGFASARLSFHRPLALQPAEVAYYARVHVYDQSGQCVWAGRLEDPGRSASGDGEVWEISAIGPAGHTHDTTLPLIYIDTDYSQLERVDNQTPGGQAGMGASPGDAAGVDQWLLLQFPSGEPLVTGSRISMRYTRVFAAGQKLARISGTWDAGVTDANHAIQFVTRTDGTLGAGEVAAGANLNVAGGTLAAVIATGFPSGRNTVEFRHFRQAGGALAVATDTFWAALQAVKVLATRYTADGTELVASADYPNDYVLAHEVVNDLLGRRLSLYDGANAAVATGSTFQIVQLAYPDGVTADDVFAELMRLEPTYFWAAWEPNPAGLYRFEWAQWPNTVRFDIAAADGFDSPGSADGLYDRVRVRWVDHTHRTRTTVRTQTVQALADAGFSREGFLDLGAEAGSSAAATQAGDQWLAEHANAPNQGTLTVARPVLDYKQGRMVYPWELPRHAPGTLIRVRGVLPRIDALNASARDGVTVFRCVAADFDAGSASARLELDAFPPSLARQVADLRRQPRRR